MEQSTIFTFLAIIMITAGALLLMVTQDRRWKAEIDRQAFAAYEDGQKNARAEILKAYRDYQKKTPISFAKHGEEIIRYYSVSPESRKAKETLEIAMGVRGFGYSMLHENSLPTVTFTDPPNQVAPEIQAAGEKP